jgi:hypothetical protein
VLTAGFDVNRWTSVNEHEASRGGGRSRARGLDGPSCTEENRPKYRKVWGRREKKCFSFICTPRCGNDHDMGSALLINN